MKRAGLPVALVVLAAAAAIAFGVWPRSRAGGRLAQEVALARAKAADFYITLRVPGLLEAARSTSLISPTGETEIAWTVSEGAWVKPGDAVMKLNPGQLEKRVGDLQKELAEAEERVRTSKADGEKRLQNARSGLQKAQEGLALAQTQNRAALERAQAEASFLEKELEVAKGQLDKRQRLAAEGLMRVTEVEAAEDEVRAKEFGLDKARRALARAKEETAAVERLRQLDLQKAELDLADAQRNIEESMVMAERGRAAKARELAEVQEQLAGCELKAPVRGMVLLDRTWEDGLRALRVGDRVWGEGQRLARIIDPSEMWAQCDISESDIERVKVGQQAWVRVPALGERALPAEVMAIGQLARERGPWEGGVPGKKVFSAIVRLRGRDSRLRPGMGANIEIELERVHRGLAVPVEALFTLGGKPAVYRLEGRRYQQVGVVVGKRNELLAVVKGDLRAGDRVALERPAASLLAAGGSKKRK